MKLLIKSDLDLASKSGEPDYDGETIGDVLMYQAEVRKFKKAMKLLADAGAKPGAMERYNATMLGRLNAILEAEEVREAAEQQAA